jgi:hypothetical protein
MSHPNSGDLFSSMSTIQALTEEAIQYINAHHRHKTIAFPDCPECIMKHMLTKIQKETQRALSEDHKPEPVSS